MPTDNPVKEYDHALDALRYLVAGIDRPRDTTQPMTWRPEEPERKDAEPPYRVMEGDRPVVMRTGEPPPPKPQSPARDEDGEARADRHHRQDYRWEAWRP